jgi:hypothetical protein
VLLTNGAANGTAVAVAAAAVTATTTTAVAAAQFVLLLLLLLPLGHNEACPYGGARCSCCRCNWLVLLDACMEYKNIQPQPSIINLNTLSLLGLGHVVALCTNRL